jgi:hypothetical protein
VQFKRFTELEACTAGLALYQESEQLMYYLAFVVGAAVCAIYFLYTNFWFLDVSVGGVHIKQLCITVGLALLPTLMLPGLVRLQVPTTGALFLQQAWLVALMEEQLYVGCALGVLFSGCFSSFVRRTLKVLHVMLRRYNALAAASGLEKCIKKPRGKMVFFRDFGSPWIRNFGGGTSVTSIASACCLLVQASIFLVALWAMECINSAKLTTLLLP